MSWNRLEQPCRCDSTLVSTVVLELWGPRQLSPLDGVRMYSARREVLGDAMNDP